MGAPINPLFLLADSQLLFRTDEDLLQRVRAQLEGDDLQAAYIGASNGDAPEFYGLFEAAMDRIGLRERRMIKSRYSAMDDIFLRASDLILLAGGDPALGWEVIVDRGIREVLVQRYLEGAVLVGVSAGAIQLGLKGRKGEAGETFDGLRLVPAIIDVHDEEHDWARLRSLVEADETGARGLGIPAGGALIYDTEHVIEPVCHPLFEVVRGDEETRTSLLFPGRRDA